MKKGLLLAVIGMLFFSSCEKDSPKTLILGKWYYATEASYSQKQYTNKYKRFCREHNEDSVSFDETIHYGFTDVYYGYWYFTSTSGDFYYLYNSGKIQEYTGAKYSINNNVFTFGASTYEILELSEKNFIVQSRDTTYFYDEDYEKQIAWVETYVNVYYKGPYGRPDPGEITEQ